MALNINNSNIFNSLLKSIISGEGISKYLNYFINKEKLKINKPMKNHHNLK